MLVLLLWGVMELRIAQPLVDLRTTARRQVLLTNLASIMVGVAFYAVSLVLPQLLQLPALDRLRARPVDGRGGAVRGAPGL